MSITRAVPAAFDWRPVLLASLTISVGQSSIGLVIAAFALVTGFNIYRGFHSTAVGEG